MPALRLRLRTTCATCGNPIPLNAALLSVQCPTCDATKSLRVADFAWITDTGLRPRGFANVHATAAEGSAVLGEADSASVACGACDASVGDDTIERGWTEGDLFCPCGKPIGMRQVPEELDSDRFWTAFIGESTGATVAPNAEPVSFSCPSCGAGLSVDGTTRTPHCEYCAKRVFLPDDLWRALRPTPKVEPFYLWVDPTWYRKWRHLRQRRARAIFLTALLVVIGMAGAAAATAFFEPTADFFSDSDSVGTAPWYDRALYSVALSWMVAWAAGSFVGSKLDPKRKLP